MARPHLPLQVLKIALAQECIWFLRCGLWRKQGWSRITRKWVSLPRAQEQICADKQDVSNRNILFLLRRSLPGPLWCHTKTWNRCKEENTIVLFILWFPLIRSRTSPTEMLSDRLMFVFEVLQYFGFWKKHLFFLTQISMFFWVFLWGTDVYLITFSRQQRVNHRLPKLMMKHTQSPVAKREGWFYSFILCF